MSNYAQETDKELEAVLGAHKTCIKIVGTGGGGNNTVTRLLEVGIKDIDVIAINTDAQDLLHAKAHQKILIGKDITSGLGAGSDPAKGEESAKENLAEIEEHLKDSDMVFITCGLGGGTGTGSAPVIAEVAKQVGALTIAVVTLPFSDEGIVRWDNAKLGLEQLQKNVDTVIVVQNDRLMDLVPDMPLGSAFKFADEILVNAVVGIAELVTEKGLVNLDFSDVRTIMQDGGLAMIGMGEGDSETSAVEAAEKALQNPLLDVDVTGAKSALINITGGPDMSLKSAKTVMKIIAEILDDSAKIIWGARVDDSMEDRLRVMLIVTCLKSVERSSPEINLPLKREQVGEISDSSTGDASFEVTVDESNKATPEENNPEEEVISVAESNKKKGGKVFSEIFLEESSVDVSLLEGGVEGLDPENREGNKEYLKTIKTACSSIDGAAELFGYNKISEFVALMSDISQEALDEKFDLSESILDLFRNIPPTLRGMIEGDEAAFEVAEEIKQKLNNSRELLPKSVSSDSNISELKEESYNVESDIDFHEIVQTDFSNDEMIDIENDELEKKNANSILISEAEGTGTNGPEAESSEAIEKQQNKSEFSNVRDAIKYFDKLL